MVAAGTMMSQPSRAAGGEIHSFHSPALELDAPSMAAGLGSLDVVQLHHQLQSGAAGVKASPRLLFDVPTMHAFIAAGGGLSPVPLTSFASSKSLELPVRCPQPSRPLALSRQCSRPAWSAHPHAPPLSGDDACAALARFGRMCHRSSPSSWPTSCCAAPSAACLERHV